jgi:hypothetical protein
LIAILALDGLEYEYVKEFNCKNLMQVEYGKTDISEFTEPRTIVIWSSFLAGKNLEERILSFGKENLWKFKLKVEESFFSKSRKWKAIDVPGFTYKLKNHEKERKVLKDFFDKKIGIEDYDKVIFENHRENKKEFFNALKKDFEIVMGYFVLADAIGHLSFGIKSKMRLIYYELDEIAKKVSKKAKKLLIISDHGMKAIGRFGDHTKNGFYSVNQVIGFKNPKITEFYNLIKKWLT